MKLMNAALAAMTVGALALASPADAHKKKYKHKHKRAHAERVVVIDRYVVGQRLPSRYYSDRTYYVRPSLYQLPPAPYGYEYVRVGNAVYLTQTETGMISQVISNLLR
jgi:Ni/Co efflux regulator RcnB